MSTPRRPAQPPEPNPSDVRTGLVTIAAAVIFLGAFLPLVIVLWKAAL